MQRHHGEARIVSTAIPSDLSRAPIVAASARPLALRLRWVAQSSIRKPGGSPTPPGASACRISATCRPARKRGPGLGLVGAGDLRRGGEAEQEGEDGEADAAHGGDLVYR